MKLRGRPMVVDFSIFPRAEHQWAIISSLGVMFSTQLSCVWFLIEAFISTSVSRNRPQNVCVCVSRNIMCIYKRGDLKNCLHHQTNTPAILHLILLLLRFFPIILFLLTFKTKQFCQIQMTKKSNTPALH